MRANGIHMQMLESPVSSKLSSFVRTTRELSGFCQEQECFLPPKQTAQAHVKAGNRLTVGGSPPSPAHWVGCHHLEAWRLLQRGRQLMGTQTGALQAVLMADVANPS